MIRLRRENASHGGLERGISGLRERVVAHVMSTASVIDMASLLVAIRYLRICAALHHLICSKTRVLRNISQIH